MAYFYSTPSLASYFKSSIDIPDIHPSIIETFSLYTTYSPDKLIPFSAIETLYNILKQSPNPPKSLLSLLKNSKIQQLQPSPQPPIRSPKLLQLLNDIQIQLDEKEYNRMISSVSNQHLNTNKSSDSFENSVKLTNGIITNVFNVLISMAAVFVALMYLTEQISKDLGIRILVALFAALVVGIAEGYFLTRDMLFQEKQETPNVE